MMNVMKITPSRDLRKPLYPVALAAITIGATLSPAEAQEPRTTDDAPRQIQQCLPGREKVRPQQETDKSGVKANKAQPSRRLPGKQAPPERRVKPELPKNASDNTKESE